MKYTIDNTQNIIERYMRQSFSIKLFSLIFFIFLVLLNYLLPNNLIFIISILFIFMFWTLDASYKKKKKIYIEIEKEGITKGLNYNNYQGIKRNVSILDNFFAKEIFFIYILQIITLITIEILFVFN